tara:strand:+ start:349 stop:600 length:252 start_codon:yes stop_codon:yes gene_type:complete
MQYLEKFSFIPKVLNLKVISLKLEFSKKVRIRVKINRKKGPSKSAKKNLIPEYSRTSAKPMTNIAFAGVGNPVKNIDCGFDIL